MEIALKGLIALVIGLLIYTGVFTTRNCKECGIERYTWQLTKNDLHCNMCKGRKINGNLPNV